MNNNECIVNDAIEPMTTIAVVGELSGKYKPVTGVAFTLNESFRMLYCAYPELKQTFGRDDKYQIVLRNKTRLNDLMQNDDTNASSLPGYYLQQIIPEMPVAGKEILIMPVVEGSGTVGRLIGGLALVGLGVLTGGTSLIIAGAVMAAQSLFFGYGEAPTDEEQKRSEILGTGNLNVAEGNPIQVVYGHEVIVGGLQVLSFSIKSEYTAL